VDSTAIIGHFRSQIMDQNRPYLWSDEEALVYLNDAQKWFCRKTEGISDVSTPEVVNIPIVAGEILAKAHPSIKTFRLALRASDGAKIDIVNHTDIRSWQNYAGAVTQMIVGMEKNVVRWNATPQVDDEANMMVYRLPLDDITEFDQELEIESEHHIHLVDWMRHLAYLKDDTEVFDKQASDRAERLFNAYCEFVAAEQRRYKQKPRAVAYGGI
jgi:hypothetical protein